MEQISISDIQRNLHKLDDFDIVLRYLLDDNHQMFLEAKETIESNACLYQIK